MSRTKWHALGCGHASNSCQDRPRNDDSRQQIRFCSTLPISVGTYHRPSDAVIARISGKECPNWDAFIGGHIFHLRFRKILFKIQKPTLQMGTLGGLLSNNIPSVGYNSHSSGWSGSSTSHPLNNPYRLGRVHVLVTNTLFNKHHCVSDAHVEKCAYHWRTGLYITRRNYLLCHCFITWFSMP